MNEKPKMPKVPPTIEVTLTLKLDHDFGRFSNGSMRMCMEPTEVSPAKVNHLATWLML